jgi:hypothetical protein
MGIRGRGPVWAGAPVPSARLTTANQNQMKQLLVLRHKCYRRKVGRPILAAAGFLPGVLQSAPHVQEPPSKWTPLSIP